MSVRGALACAGEEFLSGVKANVAGCHEFWTNPTEAKKQYTTSYLKSLVISLLVTSLVSALLLIPIHIIFYMVRLTLYFTNPEWTESVRAMHSHITFYNLLFDACWYLPLVILFMARNLGLFSSKPFFSYLDHCPKVREGLTSLPVQSDKYWMWFKASLKSIGKLVLLSLVVFLLKMGFKRLQHGLSVATVLYTQYAKYYRKVKVFADPKYGKKTGDADVARMPWLSRGHILMLVVNLGVAYLIFDNVGAATLFLRFYEWYIASIALSTELLGEYTYRLNYQQTNIFVYKKGWYLCGFGTVVLVGFYVPFVGLLLYHSFQYAGAKLLVTMLPDGWSGSPGSQRCCSQTAFEDAHLEVVDLKLFDGPLNEAKRQKVEEEEEEPEVGRLNFEADSADLPFDATIGRAGQKVRKLQANLRKQEADAEKLKSAEAQGKGEELRKELAIQKALQRARGEKVHDDVSKLRKVHKNLEMKKKKGQERWEAKIENDKQKVEEQQAQRKENLKNRGTKKKAKMLQRMGFEGERTGWLNSGAWLGPHFPSPFQVSGERFRALPDEPTTNEAALSYGSNERAAMPSGKGDEESCMNRAPAPMAESKGQGLSLRRMAMLGAYLLLAAVVTFAWANEWLDSRRSLGLYGTILGLLPGALHSRVSSRASAPARHWRYCAAAFILIVGFFVAIYPFSANSAWHSFLEDPSQSRFVLRWVDCISCCGITMVAALCVKLKHPPSNYIRHAVWAVCGSWLLIVLLCSTVFFPQKYHPLLQHWAWHLEGIDFTWIAWLMTDRIIALADTSSITMQRSGTIISLAAICFHLRIITETIFELTPFSLALQMVLASTFLLLWIFLCVRIAVCLGGSLWLLRKELPFVEGAPRVEADWAMTVVRLELLACVLITFSCTTLWWLPYKALSWAESPEVADQMLLIPVVVAHRFNHLIKAVSVAMLSGLLWPCASVPHHDDQPRAAPSVSFRLGDPDLWTAKVKELANRGFTVQCLLRFWRSLLEDKVMPTFNPLVSTTNDVVRLAIIPMSRDAETGGGRALAEIWSGGKDVPAQCMVTHNWSNLFLHTVAAVFADALKEEFYAGLDIINTARAEVKRVTASTIR
ncbi:unnamed protein product [Effrenium voratum]|nr:unnamed protein product [Effrenium voratum]